MDLSFTRSPAQVLEYFAVSESKGLSKEQVHSSKQKYGPNGWWLDPCFHAIANTVFFFFFFFFFFLIIYKALPEDPSTPLWELVLEQFKDQLVLILLGSAAISFVLAMFEEGDDWTPFVDPAVVRLQSIDDIVLTAQANIPRS